ncbi:MAG: four helix bundle protein [Flavobacteriales bacterium]|nr:four helix bundle protein [Flavobacteriales bacterium]
MTPQQLEDRLIDFAVAIVSLTEKMPNTYASRYYANQLLRSGSSPALNCGEARAAESNRDFIHKVNVIIKELRESFICLKVIEKTNLHPSNDFVSQVKSECNELISIFVASVNTAKKKRDGDS